MPGKDLETRLDFLPAMEEIGSARSAFGVGLRDFFKNGVLANGLVPSRLRCMALRLTGAKIGKAAVAPMGFIGSGPLEIGDGSFLGYQVFLDPTAGIRLGRNVRVGARSMIVTSTHKIGPTESTRTLRDRSTRVELPVSISDNVWIGMGVIVLPGVEIGSGTVIGAGAVVRQNCEANSLYAGVPARLVRRLSA